MVDKIKFITAGKDAFGVYRGKDMHLEEHHPVAQKWVELMSKKNIPFAEICFAGCGIGTSDFPIAKAVELHSGKPSLFSFLDIQAGPVMELASAYYSGHPDRSFEHESVASFYVQDIDKGLPYQNASVDGIWSRFTMHWLKKPLDAIAEFHRVLKTGGHAYIGTSTPYSLSVMNEIFLLTTIDYWTLLERFPNAIITEKFSNDLQKLIWEVNHGPEITDYFRMHPNEETYSYTKSLDSVSGNKHVTGFNGSFFKNTVSSLGFNVLEIATEGSAHYANQYQQSDDRSNTTIHVLLQKR